MQARLGAKAGKRLVSKREKEDMRTLLQFVAIYCRENHKGEKGAFFFKLFDIKALTKKDVLLCRDCSRLLTYGLTMRLNCPHDPKPMCKKCKTHCYRGDYREKIRQVMKFSGIYLVKHGRLDLLFHYLR